MFSATLMSQRQMDGRIIIKVEGADTVAIFPDGTGGSYAHTTGLAVVECDAGGRVWMECSADGTMVHADPNYHFNSFSGMLVHAF